MALQLFFTLLPFIIFLGFTVLFLYLMKKKSAENREWCDKSQATQEQIANTLLDIKRLLEKK